MGASEKVRELLKDIEKTEAVLEKIHAYYAEFKAKDLPALGRGKGSGIILAEIFSDFFTALETCFFRISKFFENSLPKERWHKELLYKMTLSIADTRAAVIGDDTWTALDEFLRFRHFKRYYFEFEYDWDRLDFLEKKYSQARGLVARDLSGFKSYLKKLM